MSEKEGTLHMMASGRWAVYCPGRLPVEITSGELFRVEVNRRATGRRSDRPHSVGARGRCFGREPRAGDRRRN